MGDIHGPWVQGEGNRAGMGPGRPSHPSCLRRTSAGSQEMPSRGCQGNHRDIVSGLLPLKGALDGLMEEIFYDLTTASENQRAKAQRLDLID